MEESEIIQQPPTETGLITKKETQTTNEKTKLAINTDNPNVKKSTDQSLIPPEKPCTNLSSSPLNYTQTPSLGMRSRIEKVLLYTKSVDLPRKSDVAREKRFLLRLGQLAVAIASFISLASATFNVNYTSAVIGISGINLTCLVSLSSMFVSFACMFVYMFPAFLGISPTRHPRFSRVEVTVDLVYFGFWLAASSALALFGRCPQFILQLDYNNMNSNSTTTTTTSSILRKRSSQYDIKAVDWEGFLGARWGCLPWNMCLALGYVCALLYASTFVMGIRDLYQFGWGYGRGGNPEIRGEMWSKGTWQDCMIEETDEKS